MRILYIDIDSLRPDHLGCYGYHRKTSPNIDALAARGVRFDNHYASDVPCLPSRTALWSGQFGIHNGVINHGGVAAEPFEDGPSRQMDARIGQINWMRCLRRARPGLKAATISPFGERHGAYHWYAGFNEVYNTGRHGHERADEIAPIAIDWIGRNATLEDWFLHVNLWDPHTPYRTPESLGNPFANDPPPAWLTEDVRRTHWAQCGPHSAREMLGFTDARPDWAANCPLQPLSAASMDDVRRVFDGYDCGVFYADQHIGRIINALADHNLLDDTAIIISADHGENLGELNIYGDHQTADECTCRIPLIVRWPGVTKSPRVDSALHYHFDFAATTIELLGGKVPDVWDAQSFATAFRAGESSGREYLVLSQGAWSCQRAVRRGDHICVKSYHDGYHLFPDVMLFNVRKDPHEQTNLTGEQPALANAMLALLDEWHEQMMRRAMHPIDRMTTVIEEGGAFHTRGELPAYLERLRRTDRAACADELQRRHARDLQKSA
ncbi:MAG TPA: sulfatase [Tepidisphaeraceae bacterium]|nr:sulfatase [Tepidisphaeraceae bacterium]